MIQDGNWVNLGDLLCSFVGTWEYIKTSRKGQELMDDTAEVGLTGSTRSVGKPYTWGSGQR